MRARYLVLTALTFAAACADHPVTGLVSLSPDAATPSKAAAPPTDGRQARDASADPVVQWNRFAGQLVALHQVAPPRAARIYAYLSIAQEQAAGSGEEGARQGAHTAVVAASARILTYFFAGELGFTDDAAVIATEAARQPRSAGSAGDREDVLGRIIGDRLIERARSDGASTPWLGSVPTGPGLWIGAAPQLAAWSGVRPWLMRSGNQFRASPPPAFGSARFLADLGEVRRLSDTRTAEQLGIAQFWADGAGTVTPPGHWNQIATDLALAHHLDERRTAHVLALMNMAISDAVVGCWDSKYTYWTIRPYQADPAITTPIGRPPHPSYPSGHACSSNAAAGVLGYLLPSDRARVDAMAMESGLSRIYGGIHYRFDIEAGARLGRSVASLAIAADSKRGPEDR